MNWLYVLLKRISNHRKVSLLLGALFVLGNCLIPTGVEAFSFGTFLNSGNAHLFANTFAPIVVTTKINDIRNLLVSTAIASTPTAAVDDYSPQSQAAAIAEAQRTTLLAQTIKSTPTSTTTKVQPKKTVSQTPTQLAPIVINYPTKIVYVQGSSNIGSSITSLANSIGQSITGLRNDITSGAISVPATDPLSLNSLTATTASTTNFFGAGLTTCQSGNVLTYNGSGKFGCTTNGGGGGTGSTKFATSTNGVAIYPNGGTNIALVLGAIATATPNSLLEVTGGAFFDRSTSTSATTTGFAITGVKNAILSTDANGAVVASTSIGTNYLSGVVSIANGGTNNSSAYTAGSLVFSNGTSLTQNNAKLFWNDSGNLLGVGTATPQWLLQLATSTKPQLTLSDASLTSNHWSFRNAGGNLYISTSSPTTFATSSRTTFTITSGGAFGYVGIGTTTPVSPLTIATTTTVTNAAFPIGLLIGQNGLSGGSANGTLIGANTAATGDLIRLQVNGNDAFKVDSAGNLTAFVAGQGSTASFVNLSVAGNLTMSSLTNTIGWSSGTLLQPPADGLLEITNNAVNGFTRIQLGGTTSSFPGLGRVNQALVAMLADGTAGGYLAVGTNTPRFLAQFASSTAPQLTLSDARAGDLHWSFRNAGGFLYIATSSDTTFATSTVSAITIDSNTGVTIGSTTAASLQVTGQVLLPNIAATTTAGMAVCYGQQAGAMGNITHTNGTSACSASSRRFKHDITPLDDVSGLAEVLALKPVSFKYNSEYLGGFINDPNWTKNFVGFIAEDVANIDPRLISTDDKGLPVNVQYPNITAILTKAVQEQQDEIQRLKDQYGSPEESGGGNWLAELGVTIEDGLAHFAHVVADLVTTKKLTVGDSQNPAASGITILDRATGNPVCVYVENGVLGSSSGECGSNGLTITPPPAPVPTPDPVPAPDASTTPPTDTGSTTPDITPAP